MNSTDSQVRSKLLHAARYGQIDEVETILKSSGLSDGQGTELGYVLLCKALRHFHVDVAKLLLAHGCAVSSRDGAAEDTPLHLAIHDVDLVQDLLDRSANVNAKNEDDETPLHLAARRDQEGVTLALLTHGAEVNARNCGGLTPLHLAAIHGKANNVALLLSNGAVVTCDVLDARRRNRMTRTLFRRDKSDWEKTIVTLLEAGSDASGYFDVATPLNCALAVVNKKRDILKFLLTRKIESTVLVPEQIAAGLTPLHCGLLTAREDIVRLMLANGADVNMRDNPYYSRHSRTPLHFAVTLGSPDMVQIILDRNPDLNTDYPALLEAFRVVNKKIIDKLIDYGFTIKPEDFFDNTLWYQIVGLGVVRLAEDIFSSGPVVVARLSEKLCLIERIVSSGNVEMLRLALRHGIGVNEYAYMNTALQCAVRQEDAGICKDMMELLLNHGAEVNQQSVNEGHTALHCASEIGDLRAVTVMLEYGADVGLRNYYDEIPLHLCTSRQVVEMLLMYGSDVNAEDGDKNTPLAVPWQQHRTAYVSHLAKLTVANRYVAKSNIKLVENDPETRKLFGDCLAEMGRLKETGIGYEVLTRMISQLSGMSEVEMQEAVRIAREPQFSNYSRELLQRVQLGKERKRVLNCAVECLNRIARCHLPYPVQREIMKRLKYRDLKMMAKAVSSRDIYVGLYESPIR